MSTPIQPGIPGLPPPDPTKELRAKLDFHTKEAAASLRDMKSTAVELAESAAADIARMPNAPDNVKKLALAFVRFRAAWIVNTEAAGRDAEALRQAMSIPANFAADVDDDFDADEEGGAE